MSTFVKREPEFIIEFIYPDLKVGMSSGGRNHFMQTEVITSVDEVKQRLAALRDLRKCGVVDNIRVAWRYPSIPATPWTEAKWGK